jgi:predicted transcriptional regulator
MGQSVKQLLRDTVEKLPADASVEEEMERLYFLSKVERGLEQADAGKTVSHEEVRRRLGL